MKVFIYLGIEANIVVVERKYIYIPTLKLT
jgi:hypothetical protein